MSVVINGTGSISGLSNVGGVSSAQSGSVLQVVQTVYQSGSAYFTTSTTATMVATGFSVSITPLFSTSKILIIFSGNAYNSGATNGNIMASIYRGGTNLSAGSTPAGFGPAYGQLVTGFAVPLNITYLDSPFTTSATTYQVYIGCGTGSVSLGSATGFPGSSSMQIIAMEIAA